MATTGHTNELNHTDNDKESVEVDKSKEKKHDSGAAGKTIEICMILTFQNITILLGLQTSRG